MFDGLIELGSINADTGELTDSTTRTRSTNYTKVKPNTWYRMTRQVGANRWIIGYKTDKTAISDGSASHPASLASIGTSGLTATFKTSPTTEYIKWYDTSSTNTTENVMISEGTEEIPFEPYGYKDKWYIHKEIDKYILDKANLTQGKTYCNVNTTWDEQNEGYIHFQFPQFIVKYGYGDKIMIADNRFPSVDIAHKNLSAEQIFAHYTNGVISITIQTSRLSGITTSSSVAEKRTAFNTWLSSNPIIIYFVEQTPTNTEITDTYLLNQLEALENGYTYEGTTNISSSGVEPIDLIISVDKPYRNAQDSITPSNYLTDFKQSREYGPVNRVQITMTDVEDAIYIENHDSINKDGIQTITINDNYFLSSEELKAEAIRPLWNSLYTMKYMPIACKYLGLPYIEMGDYLNVTMPNGDVKGTYVFNYKFTYNGGYMGELETPTISRTQETYPTESINSQVQKMGINVDRANARITSEIIARQETDANVTRIEQSIDEINLSVSTTQTDLSNLEGQVQTNTASIDVNADNISLAVEKNTQTQDQLDTLQTNTENVVNQLVFNGDGLTISALGSTSDDMKLNLTNEAINFMYNNNVVLKINGSTIEFANASFQKLDLGNYVWVAEDDDSLSLIYEGE